MKPPLLRKFNNSGFDNTIFGAMQRHAFEKYFEYIFLLFMLKIIYRRMSNLTGPCKSLQLADIGEFFKKAGLFYIGKQVN